MSDKYIIMVIAVMAIVTILLRFLPFILFDHGEKLPKWISYLGNVLTSGSDEYAFGVLLEKYKFCFRESWVSGIDMRRSCDAAA